MDHAEAKKSVTRGGRLVELRKLSFALTAQHLRDNGPLVLTELVEGTGLSRPTVIDRIAELVERGIAEVDGRREATSRRSGRPALRYRFRGEAGYVAAIDVSKRSTHVLVADLSGRIVAARRWTTKPGDTEGTGSAPRPGGTRERLEKALASIPELIPPSSRSAGLIRAGVALPGVLDSAGVITRSKDFAELLGIDVAARTSSALGVPAHVTHDLAAAGVAEHRLGAALGQSSFVLATAWPTVSAVLMIDGSAYRGSTGLAGVMYRMDLSSLLRNAYADDDSAFLRDLESRRTGAPLGGDLSEAYDLMAVQLAAATAASDPESLLLLGPAVDAHPSLVEELAARFERFVSIDLPVPVRRSSLGPLAPVVGTLLDTLDAASTEFFDHRIPSAPRITRSADVSDEWLLRLPLEEPARADAADAADAAAVEGS